MEKRSIEFLKRIHDLGHPLMPLRKDSKLPLQTAWQKRPIKPWSEMQEFIKNGHPIGLRTDRLTVVDFDSVPPARTWFIEHKSVIRVIVRTPRGIHFYFKRKNEKNSVDDFDIRSSNKGYVVAPGSTIGGLTYHCIDGYENIEHLHQFDPNWLPKRTTQTSSSIETKGDMVLRAVKYVDSINGVTKGERDNMMFKIACILVQKFGLDTNEAWPILLAYNSRCTPPLTDMKQLKRKLFEAKKMSCAFPTELE